MDSYCEEIKVLKKKHISKLPVWLFLKLPVANHPGTWVFDCLHLQKRLEMKHHIDHQHEKQTSTESRTEAD